MQKMLFGTALILSLFLSCSKNTLPKEEMPNEEVKKITEISISAPSISKTYLDGLSVLWGKDDRIAVNGLKSTAITVSADGKSAVFTTPEVSLPLHVLYPASAYMLASYNPSASKYGTMNFPKQQTIVENSFDPAAAMLIGKSSTPDNTLTLHHGAAYLKFDFSSSIHSHNIKRIDLSAPGGEDLSGEYSFNPTTMSLERSEKTGGTLSISAPDKDGVSTSKAIYVAIPATTYSSGLKLRILDVKNHFQDITSSTSFTAEAGKIYNISMPFEPSGTIIEAGPIADLVLPDAVTNILFIGNSHTLDSSDLLPTMLNSEGVRNIRMTRVYHGGYYLVGYNTNYTKANNCSIMIWEPGQHYFRGDEGLATTYSLQEAVEYGGYDIVVLQEYSGNSYCWTWSDAEKNAISGLISKIKASNPDAEIVYFLSHCFGTGYSVLVNNFGNSHVNQFNTCVSENAAHVMDPAEGFGISRIISTGALIENLRTTGLNDVEFDMMRGDKIHLDYGLTRFAASCLIWKTLFTPLTGIDPKDITYRFKEYYPSATIRSTPVTDENFPTVMAAVEAAYNHPLEITDLSSYSSQPTYVHVPGSVMVDQKGVIVEPVTFPVKFPIGYTNGKYACQSTTQPIWNGYGVWQATQQQALAKWVSVSTPVAGKIYRRTFANKAENNLSSVAIDAVWTGDYYEFIIPVKNFKAGTTIRFYAPVYNRYAPVNWRMDYLDGTQWKTAATPITLNYSFTDVTIDMTLENAVDSGFLRFRLRCQDGSVQTGPDGTVNGITPHMDDGGNYNAVFYFWNSTAKAVTFSIIN